jgi:hypothetical protein
MASDFSVALAVSLKENNWFFVTDQTPRPSTLVYKKTVKVFCSDVFVFINKSHVWDQCLMVNRDLAQKNLAFP